MESFFVILHFLQDYGCHGRVCIWHFSIAVGPTRFDPALRCAARFANFPTSWQGHDIATSPVRPFQPLQDRCVWKIVHPRFL